MARILVIDDDPEVLAFRKILLGSGGHEVRTLDNANNLVVETREFRPHLVVTDIMMPGLTGGGVCEALRAEFGPDLPIIVSSAWRIRVRSPKEKDPLIVHLPKTENPEKLLDTIQALLHKVAVPSSPVLKPRIPTPQPSIPTPQPKAPVLQSAIPNPQSAIPRPQPKSPAPQATISARPSPVRNPLFEVPRPKSETQDPKSPSQK